MEAALETGSFECAVVIVCVHGAERLAYQAHGGLTRITVMTVLEFRRCSGIATRGDSRKIRRMIANDIPLLMEGH
jgi:hypothetical protein